MSTNNKTRNQSRAMKVFASAGFKDVSMLRDIIDVLEEPAEFADLFGINGKILEEMIYTEDLLAIEGLGAKYIELLNQVGITTITQLSQREPFELHERIGHFSRTHSMGRVPNRITIEYWIEQAQEFTSNR